MFFEICLDVIDIKASTEFKRIFPQVYLKQTPYSTSEAPAPPEQQQPWPRPPNQLPKINEPIPGVENDLAGAIIAKLIFTQPQQLLFNA
uniref:Uncharacterized protein n=1 Tax=Zonotrichia albicollis TaxID=44394 RepID=A0A8D2M1D8_ZONAL